MNVSKKLVWQQGAVAQYAEIDLFVASSDGEGISIAIPNHILPQWSDAIRFGVTLFSESYAWQQPAVARMAVRVQSLKAVPCDTTLFSLAYVTFQALCSAWNIDGEGMFAFNRSSGSYSFNLQTLGGTTPSRIPELGAK
jgi:hypothetical protein